MPRGMSTSGGFDMEQFLEHCRRVKPPYECPIVVCGRVYKSYAGIQHHMTSFDHENPPPNLVTPKSVRKKGSMKRGTSPVNTPEPEPPAIPYSHDMKTVEFQLDGKELTLSVYDPIEILSKEEYEASMPPAVEEPQHQDQARTPSIKPPSKTPKTDKKLDKKQDRGIDVQSYTIEEKKGSSLPKASFTIIESYNEKLKDAPKQTSTYYRYVEKSHEELDAEIEYDADEEDRHWLDLINTKRQEQDLKPVTMESFEMLMDRLEKESFFQAQNSGRDSGPPVDEDAVCCICMDGECQNSNVILFCDMCNLAVHQECYGVPYIPEGQWLCRRCLQSPSRAVDCALCPNRGGAFKQTDDGRWAHVVCAMWIPEVCFANTVFLEPIDSIGNIPPARWKLTCYICKQRGVGACIQCNKVNCYTAFHVTCSQQAGLHMKIDAIRETSINGTSSVTVRKAAYCDMHTPADSDARPQLEEIMDAARKAAAKAASRMKMKKARKILAEKRSATPIVSVPTIPAERIKQLAELVDIDRRPYFMHRLLAYWTLKRQSRNGVPLLRRLTISSKNRKKKEEEEDDKSQSEKEEKDENGEVIVSGEGSKKVQKKEESGEGEGGEEKEAVNDENTTVLTDAERLRDEIKYWQRLRQDLERARLLCELIRKREKTKRELVRVCAEEKEMQLAPFVHLLVRTLDKIQDKDTGQIFAEPVDFEEVHDYLDVVKHPMDLSTMRQKAQAHQYPNVDAFNADFELMIENCLKYNKKDTIFYRAAIKLRDQGGAIIRALRRTVENVGFDLEAGLMLGHRPKAVPELSDMKITKEIDAALDADPDESQSLEEREKYLLDLLDKANMLRHHIARIKRVKLIRREIGVVRRKMTAKEGKEIHIGATIFTDTEEDSEKEDSDVDDSSVIDDEAEPGEPVRPCSPPRLGTALTLNHLSSTPSTPSTRPSVPATPSTCNAHPLMTATTTTPIGTPSSGRGRGRKNQLNKVDPKQKRIDSFFNHMGSTPQKESNSPPPATIPIDDAKELLDQEPPEDSTNNVISEVASLPGWKRQVCIRKNGASAGKVDVYYISPHGKKLRSIAMVVNYCTTEGIEVDLSEFDFNRTTRSSPEWKKKDPSERRKKEHSNRRKAGRPGRPPKRSRTPSGPSISPPAKKLEIGLDDEGECNTGDEGGAEESGTSVPNSPSAGVNRRTSVLFTRKADALFKKPDNSPSPQKHRHRHRKSNDGPGCDESDTEGEEGKKSKSSRKKKHSLTPTMSNKGSLMTFPDGISILELSDTIVPPAKDSFKKYREGGEIHPETDEDTNSESNSGLTDTEDDTGSDSDSDDGGTESDTSAEGGQSESSMKASHQGEVIPLEPLDLVWAKCRGYPWYPALIINPKMPKTGYFHNGVPIPVPPDDVLALALNVNFSPTYLVLFFDNKRTWQWLPRNKLEPLGVDSTLDKAKLVESRKPAERKAVKTAYEKAILHRYRVTGENAGLSGESENEGNN